MKPVDLACASNMGCVNAAMNRVNDFFTKLSLTALDGVFLPVALSASPAHLVSLVRQLTPAARPSVAGAFYGEGRDV